MDVTKPNQSNGLGVAGLTLSIVGWATCGLLCPFGLLLSLFGLDKEPKGLAVAGTIVGGIGSFFLIVMLFLGFAFFNFSRVSGSAQFKAAQAQLSQLQTPLAIYQMDIGSYPTSAQGLDALRNPPADLPDPTTWNGPYVASDIPLDPWGSRYRYQLLSTGHYIISSAGPDRINGNADDIVKSGRN